MKSLRNLSILIIFAVSLITAAHVQASPALSSPVTGSIYHPNGMLAWNFDYYSPFYHDNGVEAWGGIFHPSRDFRYSNGRTAWFGYTNKQSLFSYDLSTVYHSNGAKMWQGAANKDTFSYGPCSIYHHNGTLAWKGALNKETSFSYDPCTLFHGNGVAAWKGAAPNETYAYDPCTFFHANGQPAWRGYFAFENSDIFASGIFYDNGQLAWSGQRGDPLFDRYGMVQQFAVDAVNLPLGLDSWLYVSCNGERVLNLSIGFGTYLQFTNATEEPGLSVFLGQGYYLRFYPHDANTPMLSCYDYNYLINY